MILNDIILYNVYIIYILFCMFYHLNLNNILDLHLTILSTRCPFNIKVFLNTSNNRETRCFFAPCAVKKFKIFFKR